MPRPWSTPFAVFLLGLLAFAPSLRAQTPWAEGFEGPALSWLEVGGDAAYRIQQHARIANEAHSGRQCEWFQIAADGGTAVFVAHDVGRPRVIDDLRPTVWIKSDRGGLQLAADIELPRTIDPRTGRPVVTRVFGTAYATVGRWEQLRIDDIPRQLNRQVRMLRSQLGPSVDGREAHLSRVVLNLYGGPGVTNVWIDDLEVAGYVRPDYRGNPSPGGRPRLEPVSVTRPSPAMPPAANPAPPRVQLSGSVLLVDGRPFLPRAIEYRGERLEYLKELGFNAVWLRREPPPGLLDAARRLDLWLVCPPPPSDTPSIGPEFSQVLTWDLGSGLTGEHVEPVRRRADAVRLADRERRPLVCAPRDNLRAYSRAANLLLIDRCPLGTSLELPDYGIWIRRQPLLALPGTPVWTTVGTQMGESHRRQWSMLAGRPIGSLSVPIEQMRLLVYVAISSGSRGLFFQSQTTLEADDPETRQRAMTVELMNRELDMIEPWVAAGSFVTTAETSEKFVNGAVLRSDRARLVVPAWLAKGGQCVPPAGGASSMTMLVPGAPDSSSAYELTAGRLQPLRHKRATGGMRISLEDFNLTALVLLAQDPLVIDAVTRRAAANGKRGAELERNLAVRKFEVISQVAGALTSHTPESFQLGKNLAAARQNLGWADAHLKAGDGASALTSVRRALWPLRSLERAYWENAVTGATTPAMFPGTACFAALRWHWKFMDWLSTAGPGPNYLPGGDFESFDAMLRTGWRHEQGSVPGVQSAADLVPDAPHGGALSLRLTARSDDPENPPALLETPPVRIVTPAVPVVAGQVIRIHGWVKIPAPLAASVDGLVIADSIGGDDLAERIDKTGDWREFTLYRLADQTAAMTVSFALTGLGEARLDDVSIEVMGANGVVRLPPLGAMPRR